MRPQTRPRWRRTTFAGQAVSATAGFDSATLGRRTRPLISDEATRFARALYFFFWEATLGSRRRGGLCRPDFVLLAVNAAWFLSDFSNDKIRLYLPPERRLKWRREKLFDCQTRFHNRKSVWHSIEEKCYRGFATIRPNICGCVRFVRNNTA